MSTKNNIVLVNQFGEQSTNEIIGPIISESGAAWYSGSGNPSFSAPAGSYYTKSNPSGASDIFWVNATEGNHWELLPSGGGGGGANTSLSNLATTSVNAHILPAADEQKNFGSSLLKWLNGYFKTLNTSFVVGNDPDLAFSTSAADGNFNFVGNINQYRNDNSNGIKFFDNSNTDYVGFGVPDTLGVTTDYLLPPTDGGPGQALLTDGAGNLSWGGIANLTSVSRIFLGTDFTGNQPYTTNQVTGLDFPVAAGKKYYVKYTLIMNPAGTGGIGVYYGFPTSTNLAGGIGQGQVGTFPTSLTPATDSRFGDILPPTFAQYFIWETTVLINNVTTNGTFTFGFRSGGATDVTIAAGSVVTIQEI